MSDLVWRGVAMARVAWRVAATGAEGHGEYIDAAIAEKWVKRQNERHGLAIIHWLEYAS